MDEWNSNVRPSVAHPPLPDLDLGQRRGFRSAGLNLSLLLSLVLAVLALGSGCQCGLLPVDDCQSAACPLDGGVVDYEWAQWTIPPISPVAESFWVGPDTVTHVTTRLVWQRAPAPNDGGYTWASARDYCAGLSLGGLVGWRLPTLIELESIVDYSKSNPAIEPTVFPATPTGYGLENSFWSGSTGGLDAGSAGAVAFTAGHAAANTYYAKTSRYQVRCVRCWEVPCSVPIAAAAGAPEGRYNVGTDTVYDTKTTLTWQRTGPAPTYTWADAETFCAGLSLSGTGWRLPTVKELQSLVDTRARVAPTIDTVAFPGAPAVPPGSGTFFWSSSPDVKRPSNAWVVNFAHGTTGLATSASNHVRCVR